MNSKVTSATIVTTVITTYLMLYNYHMLDFLNSIVIFEYTLNQIIFMSLIIGAIATIIGMFGFSKQSGEQVQSMLKNISGLSDKEMNRFENSLKNQYKQKIESKIPGLSKLEGLKSIITNPQSTTTNSSTSTATVSLTKKISLGKRSKEFYPEPSEFIKYLGSLQSTLVLNPKIVLDTQTIDIQSPLSIIKAIPFSDVAETKKKSSKSKLLIILAAIIIAANLIYLFYTGGLSFIV